MARSSFFELFFNFLLLEKLANFICHCGREVYSLLIVHTPNSQRHLFATKKSGRFRIKSTYICEYINTVLWLITTKSLSDRLRPLYKFDSFTLDNILALNSYFPHDDNNNTAADSTADASIIRVYGKTLPSQGTNTHVFKRRQRSLLLRMFCSTNETSPVYH